MKITVTLVLSFASVYALAGSAVESYLDGAQKVCVYADGYKVRVGIADQCPILVGH